MINVVNKRTFKGEHGFYIGRGSALGNPFTHRKGTKAEFVVDSIQESVDRYSEWLDEKLKSKDKLVCDEMNKLYRYYKIHHELNLICYCKWKGNELCHGDVVKGVLDNVINKV